MSKRIRSLRLLAVFFIISMMYGCKSLEVTDINFTKWRHNNISWRNS